MKKLLRNSLLALAAMAMAGTASLQAKNFYILGQANGNTWAPNVGVQMEADEDDPDIYFSATVTFNGEDNGYSYFSFSEALGANADDWSGIASSRWGATSNNFDLTSYIDEEDATIQKGENAFKIPAGTYSIDVDLDDKIISIYAEEPEDPDAVHVYVIGTVDEMTAWNPSEGTELYNEEGDNVLYTGEGIVVENSGDGYGYFGFTTKLAEDASDWNSIASSRFGAVGSGDVEITDAMLGTELSLTKAGYQAFKLAAGTYDFSVNYSTMKLTVVKGTDEPDDPDEGDVFVMGDVNGNHFAANVGVEMTADEDADDDIYTLTADFTNSSADDGFSYFSFTKALAENADDWDAIAANRFGAVSTGDFWLNDELLGQEISMTFENGQAIRAPQGNYSLSLNLTTMKLVITRNSLVPAPAAPTFSPAAGEYEGSVNVTIAAEDGAVIRYTIDGNDPDRASAIYAEPIVLNEVGSKTVKAIAIKNGIASEIASAEYVIKEQGGDEPGEMVLKKIWEYKTNGNPANTDARFATGFDGKVYVADKAAGEVKVYDADGAKSYAAVEGMGAAITSDDAGNILVNKGFPGATSFNDWVIIKPDGTQTALTIAAPDGVTAARTDQVGRIVGDVMSADGGYMYLAANGQGSVAAIKIANGQQDAEASLASPATGLALTTSFIAQPACETVEDVEAAVDASATFYLRNRTDQKILGWNEDGTELSNLGTVGGGTCEGFDYFFYNDEMYAVAAAARTFQFQLKNMTTGDIIAEEGDAEALSNQFRAYTVRKEGNNKFGIYIWNAAGGAAYYTYGSSSGVESVAAEGEVVATAYYNLQGVRVNNPAAGQILVKVNTLSNGKVSASKVLVR